MFKKILLAINPSPLCQCAADAAFNLSRQLNAELIIFHACNLPCHSWLDKNVILESEKLNSIKKNIADFYGEKLNNLPAYSIQVAPGIVHEEILHAARREKADLIIMGPHSVAEDEQRNQMWGMLSSTVQRVTQASFFPVMTVSQEPSVQSNWPSRIVFATDFSTPSRSALNFACRMSRAFDAHLHIFHVLDMGLCYPNPDYYQIDMTQAIQRSIKKMEWEYTPLLKGTNYSFEAWEGTPYVEILKYARWKEADAIIMAHHSRKVDTRSAVIGATASQVALTPSCPTFIINYKVEPCL
jgi:nucleotide-binding universal stress UspA family protein